MSIPSFSRIALLSAFVLGFNTFNSHAATLSVTNLNDSGAGSLRQAIASASATPDADTITFVSSLKGILTLKTGELTINSNVKVIGPGASVLTVSGNNNSRILTIASGTVSLSGLTFANGLVKGQDGGDVSLDGTRSGESVFGGAIVNRGILTLTGMVLRNNRAHGGNGIEAENYYVRQSGAGGMARGGALFSTGTLKLVDVQLQSNTAQG